jgi:hypothetical protein
MRNVIVYSILKKRPISSMVPQSAAMVSWEEMER